MTVISRNAFQDEQESLGHMPRMWLLGQAECAASGKNAIQRYIDGLVDHGSKTWLEYDAVANELSHEVATSEPNSTGRTSSLHALRTDDTQQFHIHLPHTEPGTTVDAERLKDTASHRLLFIVTGEKPGLFEWAEAKGPIEVTQENGLTVAKGAVEPKGYSVQVPPYSMAVIELTGGIHRFHNVRALSFHRENAPKGNYEGDNLLLNTQQWHGDMPQEMKPLEHSSIYRNLGKSVNAPVLFDDVGLLRLFMQRANKMLVERAVTPPNSEVNWRNDTRHMMYDMNILASSLTMRNVGGRGIVMG